MKKIIVKFAENEPIEVDAYELNFDMTSQSYTNFENNENQILFARTIPSGIFKENPSNKIRLSYPSKIRMYPNQYCIDNDICYDGGKTYDQRNIGAYAKLGVPIVASGIDPSRYGYLDFYFGYYNENAIVFAEDTRTAYVNQIVKLDGIDFEFTEVVPPAPPTEAYDNLKLAILNDSYDFN